MNNALQNLPVQVLGPGAVQEDEEIDLRQILNLAVAGRWTIIGIIAACLLLAGLYCLLIPPTYEADGTVQVEDNTKSGGMSDLGQISSLLLGTPVETEAEIQILQSRLVVGQVIDKMNLEVEVTPRHFPIFGSAIARWRHDLAEPAAAPLGLGSFAWGGERLEVTSFDVPASEVGNVYRLRALTEGNYELYDDSGNKVLTGKVGERATAGDGRTSIFVQSMSARPGTGFRVTRRSRPELIDEIGKNLSVSEEGKQSGVIQIGFTGKSPEFVTDFIANLENAYLRQNVERRSADAQMSLEFLNKQLPQLKAALDGAQARLAAYQKNHGAPDVTAETQLLLQHNVDLETQRLQLVQQRDEALQKYTPEHPTVKALNQQMASLERELTELKTKTSALPATQQEVLSFMRDLDVNTQLYTAMLNSIQELQVAKAGTIGNVRIIDAPLLPTEKSKPKTTLTLALALIGSAILGMAVVFVQRALLRGIDDPSEIERAFGLAVYAMIPFSKDQQRLASLMSRGGGKDKRYVLALTDPDSVAIEALRSLRTSLHFALLEAKNNVVMLTGPSPGLGKSFVSVNLAALLAASGKRVVLVDADLRRGRVHEFIGTSSGPGVADYVAGTATLDEISFKELTEGLTIMPRGSSPPNPAELLLNQHFSELMKALSQQYDLVIVDTPPVLAVADAAIVGALAGTTFVVLKSGEHPTREIDDTIKRLAGAGVHVKGILFNQVGARAGSYGYGGYGYTYYKYT